MNGLGPKIGDILISTEHYYKKFNHHGIWEVIELRKYKEEQELPDGLILAPIFTDIKGTPPFAFRSGVQSYFPMKDFLRFFVNIS